MLKPSDVYDKREIYNEQMKPLVDQLLSVSRRNNIPIVVSAAVANDEEHTEYETNTVLAVTELSLFENRIARLLFIMNDFYAEAPEEIRNMVRDLTYYLKPSVPDVGERINIRLTDDKIYDMYRSLCHKMELHFPEGIFASVPDDD